MCGVWELEVVVEAEADLPGVSLVADLGAIVVPLVLVIAVDQEDSSTMAANCS
jgi:hypothetical protein